MKKVKYISIRIDEDMLQKLSYIAKYENRSTSGQLMYLIDSCIREFEDKHGRIEKAKKSD